MAKLNQVKKARKDIPEHGIKRGDSYYWWQFAFEPRTISKEKPKRSELTKSEYQKDLFDMEDEFELMWKESTEDADQLRKYFIHRISKLEQKQKERLGNMPDHLHSSPVGRLLNERINELAEWKESMMNDSKIRLRIS